MPNGRRLLGALKGYTGIGIMRPTARTFNVLRSAGISYRTSSRGATRVTGRMRPPRSVFPRARYKVLRKITY